MNAEFLKHFPCWGAERGLPAEYLEKIKNAIVIAVKRL